MENNKKDITLDGLAQMVAKGFANTASKQDVQDLRSDFDDQRSDFNGLRQEFKDLRTDVKEEVAELNAIVNRHIGNNQEQIDALAGRVKTLEQEVFSR